MNKLKMKIEMPMTMNERGKPLIRKIKPGRKVKAPPTIPKIPAKKPIRNVEPQPKKA